jgi:hypothetical protein
MDKHEREEKRRRAREWYTRRRDEAPPEVREQWRRKQRAANAASYRRHRATRLAQHRKYLKKNAEVVRAKFAAHRELHRDEIREYMRRYRIEHADRVNAANKRWRGRNPDYKRTPKQQRKVAARRILRLAISAGLVEKPEHCEGCGKKCPARRLHGHHHDGYERPLDVQWLCSVCHGKAHRKV